MCPGAQNAQFVMMEQASAESISCPGETMQAVLRRDSVSWDNRRPQKAYCVLGRHCRVSSEGTMCPGRKGVLRRHIVSWGETSDCPQNAKRVLVEHCRVQRL